MEEKEKKVMVGVFVEKAFLKELDIYRITNELGDSRGDFLRYLMRKEMGKSDNGCGDEHEGTEGNLSESA